MCIKSSFCLGSYESRVTKILFCFCLPFQKFPVVIRIGNREDLRCSEKIIIVISNSFVLFPSFIVQLPLTNFFLIFKLLVVSQPGAQVWPIIFSPLKIRTVQINVLTYWCGSVFWQSCQNMYCYAVSYTDLSHSPISAR